MLAPIPNRGVVAICMHALDHAGAKWVRPSPNAHPPPLPPLWGPRGRGPPRFQGEIKMWTSLATLAAATSWLLTKCPPTSTPTTQAVGNGCHKQPPMAPWPMALPPWLCGTTMDASNRSTYLIAEFHRLSLGARDGERHATSPHYLFGTRMVLLQKFIMS